MTYDPTLNEMKKQWREESQRDQEWTALQDVMFTLAQAPIGDPLREQLVGLIQARMTLLVPKESDDSFLSRATSSAGE